MAFETHKDDSPQATGTHQGANGASSLYHKGANFDVYIKIGVDCHNTTQVTNGAVTAVTKDTVTVSGVTWDLDDVYEIYVTDTKDSFISSFRISEIYGRKLTRDYTEDEPDLPEDSFGPGQPEGH